MKKLMIVLFSLGLAYGASAQRGHFGGFHGGVYGRPQVVVGVGALAITVQANWICR
jgi:hypothetical protein